MSVSLACLGCSAVIAESSSRCYDLPARLVPGCTEPGIAQAAAKRYAETATTPSPWRRYWPASSGRGRGQDEDGGGTGR